MRSFWIFVFFIGCMGSALGQLYSVSQETIDSLMREAGRLTPFQRDSLRSAIMERFSVDELMEVNKLHDSLFGQGDRRALVIHPDRIKNDLLIKPISEIPGASVYLPLPDDWKNIDPFAHWSMAPRHPKPDVAPVPDYMRFTVGMTGYYFAFQEAGYYGYGWTTLDSLQTVEVHFALPQERGTRSPGLLNTLERSKKALIILAVILQALLL